MGANKIAYWLGVSPNSVREAKKIIQRQAMMRNIPDSKKIEHKIPQILILDIETAPMKAFVWGVWKQDVHQEQLISAWFILSWAAKWLLADDIMSNRLTPNEVLFEDDNRIVNNLWKVLNEADIVIAHNGERFDIPRIKSRFLIHGLPPTTFYQQIDTLKVARREFDFPSNKLDALAKLLGHESKQSVDFELWSDCLNGNDSSLRHMEEYNRQDVKVLESVYLSIRPYIKGHPNYNLYVDSEKPLCPHCGHDELVFAGYYYYTPTGKYRNLRCTSCGALSRERQSVYRNRKNILVSNGR
jgi:DNA polymerase elongation subunit (family B)